jgi:hypothetical protein
LIISVRIEVNKPTRYTGKFISISFYFGE